MYSKSTSLSSLERRYRRISAFDDARAAVGRAQFEMLMTLVDCDDPAIWDDGSFDGLPDHYEGSRDMARWISGKVGITNFTARRWLAAAHALKKLPLISEAFCRGELSMDKMLNLCRIATSENEARLLRWAYRVSVSAVRDRAERECAPPVEEAAQVQNERFLRHWTELGGTVALFGRFPNDQGKMIVDAIDRIATLEVPKLPSDEADIDPFSSDDGLDQRRADALYLLALGDCGISSGDAPTMIVHAQLDALLSETMGAQFEGGGVIHPATAARLCCDARIQLVLENPDGQAVGIGFASRNLPRWLRRQLRYRDGRCSFPGCEGSQFMQAHHIVHWPLGPTDLVNLMMVCTFHHRLLHEHGWNARLDAHTGVVTWLRPDGSALERAGPERAGPARSAA